MLIFRYQHASLSTPQSCKTKSNVRIFLTHLSRPSCYHPQKSDGRCVCLAMLSRYGRYLFFLHLFNRAAFLVWPFPKWRLSFQVSRSLSPLLHLALGSPCTTLLSSFPTWTYVLMTSLTLSSEHQVRNQVKRMPSPFDPSLTCILERLQSVKVQWSSLYYIFHKEFFHGVYNSCCGPLFIPTVPNEKDKKEKIQKRQPAQWNRENVHKEEQSKARTVTTANNVRHRTKSIMLAKQLHYSY